MLYAIYRVVDMYIENYAMLSRTAEYAVRAALWLAADTRQPRTVRQIARGTAVPAGYLAKILQALGRAGLVTAQPGPGGGFMLSGEPNEIALLTVIDAVDPIVRIHACPLNIASHSSCLCPLHARLDAVQAYLQQSFGACSLADLLVESGGGGKPFCGAADDPCAHHDRDAACCDGCTDAAADCPPNDGTGIPPTSQQSPVKGKQL